MTKSRRSDDEAAEQQPGPWILTPSTPVLPRSPIGIAGPGGSYCRSAAPRERDASPQSADPCVYIPQHLGLIGEGTRPSRRRQAGSQACLVVAAENLVSV